MHLKNNGHRQPGSPHHGLRRYLHAKFRIPIFGYCPKSPEPEHSSGSGPEFRDPQPESLKFSYLGTI